MRGAPGHRRARCKLARTDCIHPHAPPSPAAFRHRTRRTLPHEKYIPPRKDAFASAKAMVIDMHVVIGIDVGGSTTKIVGFTESGGLIEPMLVRATDPVTSIYGAFGKFTAQNGIALTQVSRIMATGVGSSYLTQPMYGLDCRSVSEFTSVGLGGLYLSGLDHAIVVSMGTGTALINARSGKEMEYLGGTGIGGGTLMGLSKTMLGLDNIDSIVELASRGNLANVDLRITDITRKDSMISMPGEMTASNFGKVSDLATKEDLALGLINMVFESIGMLAVFASRAFGTKDIVLTGNLTNVPQSAHIFRVLSEMFNVRFLIPEHAQYATVIGAALSDPGKI